MYQRFWLDDEKKNYPFVKYTLNFFSYYKNMKYPILVPNIFNHPFTYESSLKLKVGDYVMVPFGKSKITGVVWDEFEKNNNKNFKTKNIIKKLDVTPLKKNTIIF